MDISGSKSNIEDTIAIRKIIFRVSKLWQVTGTDWENSSDALLVAISQQSIRKFIQWIETKLYTENDVPLCSIAIGPDGTKEVGIDTKPFVYDALSASSLV